MAAADVTSRVLELFSEGTRIVSTIYTPAGAAPEGGFPAILLCHGWGGLMAHLTYNAQAFAGAGYVAMIFDYRGWGQSDGRIIPAPGAPALLEAGTRMLEVQVLREVVDPIDQAADIRACLTVLEAEAGVNPARLAVWGTSFGGGHAVFTAGTDRRIRAAVAQIGAYGLPPEAAEAARARAADKVFGRIAPVVPQGGLDGTPGLAGTPDLARMAAHSPLAAAANVRVPTLIIDAEQEELFNRLEHGFTAYMIIRQNAVTEYRTFPCKHYTVYEKYFQESVAMALEWFGKHL